MPNVDYAEVQTMQLHDDDDVRDTRIGTWVQVSRLRNMQRYSNYRAEVVLSACVVQDAAREQRAQCAQRNSDDDLVCFDENSCIP